MMELHARNVSAKLALDLLLLLYTVCVIAVEDHRRTRDVVGKCGDVCVCPTPCPPIAP